MKKRGDQTAFSTDTLLVEIVDTLEEQGIDEETYTVYDYVDADALTEVVASADASLEIEITIEGVRLSITQDGVHVIT